MLLMCAYVEGWVVCWWGKRGWWGPMGLVKLAELAVMVVGLVELVAVAVMAVVDWPPLADADDSFPFVVLCRSWRLRLATPSSSRCLRARVWTSVVCRSRLCERLAPLARATRTSASRCEHCGGTAWGHCLVRWALR